MKDSLTNEEGVFRFKRFDVRHSGAAMKVGTDGILLGAWCDTADAAVVWDVGCGSGLIGLMIAQRSDASVTGIEIEADAASDAEFNMANSDWSARLAVVRGDVCSLYKELPRPDLIVSNPPFYDNSPAAGTVKRQMARIETSLNVRSLVRIASESLSDAGRMCLILPYSRSEEFEWECRLNRLFPRKRVDVRSRADKMPIRTLWEVSKFDGDFDLRMESIRNADNSYSEWYLKLTNDYYLYLK